MKRFHRQQDGQEVEERLDDFSPPPPPPDGTKIKAKHQTSYMETWDVVQGPHPVHGSPSGNQDPDVNMD